MIVWLQPSALWGLLLLAVPVVIHLLRPREARRVPFPSIRFVRESPVASVRMGRPSDLALLAARAGIVAGAVLALAQPLVVSESRLADWNGRSARAVVVDASASMGMEFTGRSAAAEADEVTAAELAGAAAGTRIDSEDLGEGIRRAAAWLRTAPPARREIVVLSDFALGSITKGKLALAPPDAGLRLVQVGGGLPVRPVEDQPLLAVAGVDRRIVRTRVAPESTAVEIFAGSFVPQPGLRVAGASDAEAQPLLSAVARAGTPAPAAEQPVVFDFAPSAGNDGALKPLTERWMIETAMGVERDAEIRRLAIDLDGEASVPPDLWMVAVRDAAGRPLVRMAALDAELMVRISAPVRSYFAAAAVRAVLVARRGSMERPEQEVSRVPAAALAAWSRPPAAVGRESWLHAESSDARWCWASALALLILEQWLRRRSRPAMERARAAA